MKKKSKKLSLPSGFYARPNTAYDPTSGLPLAIVGAVDQQEMVLVPAGEFLMGTSEAQVDHILQIFLTPLEGSENRPEFLRIPGIVNLDRDYFHDEMPQHRVWLDAFYIDKYEVTHAAYFAFCAETGRQTPSYWEGGDFPDGTRKNAVREAQGLSANDPLQREDGHPNQLRSAGPWQQMVIIRT